MASIDRRGNSVDASDPPVATDPNPGLAIKAPVVAATTVNIALSGLQTIDGVVLISGNRVLVKNQTNQTTNGIYNASTGNWTRTTDANSNDQITQGMQVLVSQGTISVNTIFQLTTANPVLLGTSSIVFIRTSVPSTVGTTAPLTGGGSVSSNPVLALAINASLQVTGGNLAVATLAGVTHSWVSSINASGVPQLTQPAFSDISGTATAAQIPALPSAVTLAGSILATNVSAPSTPAAGKTSLYVDATQKVLSAKNDAGTVSITVVPASAAAGQFVTGIGAGGALSFGTPAGSGTVNSSTAGQIAYYPTSTSAVSGNPNLTISGAALTLANSAIGAISSDGYVLQNATAAANGAQQWSPRFHFIGQGWGTTGPASQTHDWITEVQTTQGATSTSKLVLSQQVAGAGYVVQASFIGGGVFDILTGLRVNGAATLANVLRGNGTNFVSAALAAADLSNGVSGTGAVALVTGATLVTPTLGAATATSINKVAITAPASAATLTIANNKTLTVNNTLTFTGTDATSFAFPGASDTVGALGAAQSWTAQNILNIASTITSATAAALDDLKVAAATTTITGNTGSPITKLAKIGLYQPTFTDASVVTVTDATTLYIDNAPVAAGSVTITNAWALRVGAGASKLQATTLNGALTYGGVTLSNAVTGTGNMVLATSPTIATPTVTTSAVIPIIGPPSNSTTAIKITKADLSTAVMTFDTTNARVGINKTPGAFDLDVNGAVNLGSTLAVSGHVTVEGVTSTGATGTGKLVFDGSPTLVTPVLGTATATKITAANGIANGFFLTAASGTNGSLSMGAGGSVIFVIGSAIAGFAVNDHLANTVLFVQEGTPGTANTAQTTISGQIFGPDIATTASAANAFIDTGTSPVGQLKRSTSSLVYKRDVEPLDPAAALKVLSGAKPIWYRSRCTADNPAWSWYGLGAEDMAAVDPRLVHYGYQDDDFEDVSVPDPHRGKPFTRIERRLKAAATLKPDGVQYERLVPHLIAGWQTHEARLAALESRIH